MGVATGGTSSEREISLRTGAAFEEALRSRGYEVQVYDVATDLQRLLEDKPAALLLGVHGGTGESGVLQGMLELFEIPYTGSGVLASALAMDKTRAKILCAEAGVPVAAARTFRKADCLGIEDFTALAGSLEAELGLPMVVKLNDAGSSVGVVLCETPEGVDEALRSLAGQLSEAASAGIIAEAYLSGPEYSVGFFGEQCLGLMEIIPGAGFYDYEAKYQRADTEYRLIEDVDVVEPLTRWGLQALRALGCRGVARVDFKGDPREGRSAMLEVNTIPGMTATSLVPKLAGHRGVSFEDFVEAMVSTATLETQVQ